MPCLRGGVEGLGGLVAGGGVATSRSAQSYPSVAIAVAEAESAGVALPSAAGWEMAGVAIGVVAAAGAGEGETSSRPSSSRGMGTFSIAMCIVYQAQTCVWPKYRTCSMVLSQLCMAEVHGTVSDPTTCSCRLAPTRPPARTWTTRQRGCGSSAPMRGSAPLLGSPP
jgi:hypothetical protein